MTLPLFAYGTLRDPQYQRELFGRTFVMHDAQVAGFAVVSTGAGYLAATPRPGSTVAGALVELDDGAYAVADAWEDLTVYERTIVEARRPNGKSRRAIMYIVRDARGSAVSDARLSDRARADVVEDIRRFRASANVTDPP